jgi:hypothetical protein
MYDSAWLRLGPGSRPQRYRCAARTEVHAQSVEVFALLTIPPIEIVCAELAARLDQILMGNDVPGSSAQMQTTK